MGPRSKKSMNGFILSAMAAALWLPPSRAAETPLQPAEWTGGELAPNLILITYQVDGQERKGNGVLVRMDGKSYLLTNLHIILGAERMTFTTASGKPMTPRGIELSNNRDLARLAVNEEDFGLSLTVNAKMNTPVEVHLGGDGNEQSVKHGKIIGVGGGKIEISAEFDESGNGAPVLNPEREVVGIAAYSLESSPHAMKIGTRFEGKKRYFCYRVGQDDWRPVNWKTFNAKYGKAYHRHQAFYEQIIAIFQAADKFTASAEKANGLATECRTHARQLRLLSEQRDLPDFLLTHFEEQAEMLEYAGGQFHEYANRKL